MKKLFFGLTLLSLCHTANGQRARVFEHFTTAVAFGNNVAVPSLAYSQSLALGQDYGVRFHAGLRYSQFFLNKDATLERPAPSLTEIRSVDKGLSSGALNILTGFEMGTRLIAAGINVDVVGFSIGKVRSVEVASGDGDAGILKNIQARPETFNFIGNQRGMLNNQLYVAFTPNPNLTVRGGLAYTQMQYKVSYELIEGVRQELGTFEEQHFRPFVALQFNFEK